MLVQERPAPSQRCHWWPRSIVGVPVHVPSRDVGVEPTRGVPVTDGAAVLTVSSGASVSSAPAAIVFHPERCPAYASPTVVPVSGTSTGAALAFLTCSRPSCSHAV